MRKDAVRVIESLLRETNVRRRYDHFRLHERSLGQREPPRDAVRFAFKKAQIARRTKELDMFRRVIVTLTRCDLDTRLASFPRSGVGVGTVHRIAQECPKVVQQFNKPQGSDFPNPPRKIRIKAAVKPLKTIRWRERCVF